MAKPTQSPTAAGERILVDGDTPFVFITPPFLDADEQPLIARTCDVEMALPNGELVHPTLRAYARCRGDGTYHVAFTARAMWLHLTTDRQAIHLIVRVRGYKAIAIPAIVERTHG